MDGKYKCENCGATLFFYLKGTEVKKDTIEIKCFRCKTKNTVVIKKAEHEEHVIE